MNKNRINETDYQKHRNSGSMPRYKKPQKSEYVSRKGFHPTGKNGKHGDVQYSFPLPDHLHGEFGSEVSLDTLHTLDAATHEMLLEASDKHCRDAKANKMRALKISNPPLWKHLKREHKRIRNKFRRWKRENDRKAA